MDKTRGGGGEEVKNKSVFVHDQGIKTVHAKGALCVEMDFTWTFPRNLDATVKLKSEFISIIF